MQVHLYFMLWCELRIVHVDTGTFYVLIIPICTYPYSEAFVEAGAGRTRPARTCNVRYVWSAWTYVVRVRIANLKREQLRKHIGAKKKECLP